jgi:hypothetical protein
MNRDARDPWVRGQLLNRIRGEYDEMPDLKLTSWQACRLWNLTAALCDSMLETLVSERFLVRTATGAYLRGTAQSIERAGVTLRMVQRESSRHDVT